MAKRLDANWKMRKSSTVESKIQFSINSPKLPISTNWAAQADTVPSEWFINAWFTIVNQLTPAGVEALYKFNEKLDNNQSKYIFQIKQKLSEA